MARLMIALIIALALGPLSAATGAQESAVRDPAQTVPAPSVTQHEVRVNGRALRYTATAGYMPIESESGDLQAKMFFIAYTLDGVSDVARRPLTFAFNGGPGSSSVWLHLGAIGPKRVRMTDEGEALPPPYRLVDNEGTWLPFTDVVFIDPVLTGYSRPATGVDKSEFHGLEEDVESVGEFIRLWTTRNGRWSSPKFLAGESYGTTRAAGLSNYLQDRYGMYLNGIVLISTALDFGTLRFAPSNDLPFILILPSYTATAWYHGRLEPELQNGDLEGLLAKVREFALTEYAVALLKGANLPATQRRDVVRKLARYSGLQAEFIEDADLRVGLRRFAKELLRDEGRTVGRLDSRFKGMDRDDAGGSFEYDPSYAAIQGPYTAMLNAYVREQLGYETDLPYEILTGRVRPWNWGSASEGYPSVTEDLRQAMSQNPALRVLVANGYYDMATPFLASEYVFAHLGGDESLQERIEHTYYPAGHMMYIQRASLRRLTRNVERFVSAAVGAGQEVTATDGR